MACATVVENKAQSKHRVCLFGYTCQKKKAVVVWDMGARATRIIIYKWGKNGHVHAVRYSTRTPKVKYTYMVDISGPSGFRPFHKRLVAQCVHDRRTSARA